MKKLLLIIAILASYVQNVNAQADACGSATAVTVGAAALTGQSIAGLTLDPTDPAAPAAWTDGPTLDVSGWYSFTVPTTDLTVSYVISTDCTPAGGATGPEDTQLGVYSGACGTLTLVSANDDISGTNYASSVTLAPGLTAGTYYILVDGWDFTNDPTAATNFCMSVTTIPAVFPPANDDVCTPTNLIVDGASDCGNTTAATVEATDVSAGACSAPNNTVWYTVTPATTGLHAFEFTPDTGAGFDAWVEVFSVTGCPGAPVLTPIAGGDCATLGAVGPAAGVTTTASITLTAGTTYYVSLDGFSGGLGDYCFSAKSVAVIPCASADGGTVGLPAGETSVICSTLPNDSIWVEFAGQVIPNITPGASGAAIILSSVPYATVAAFNTDLTAVSPNLINIYGGVADGIYFLNATNEGLVPGTYYITNLTFGDTLADGNPDPACADLSNSYMFTVIDCGTPTCLSTWTDVTVTGGTCPGEDLVFNIAGLTLDASQSLTLAVVTDAAGAAFSNLAAEGFTDYQTAHAALAAPWGVVFDDLGIGYVVDAAAGTVTVPGGLSATQCTPFDLYIYLAVVDGAPTAYTATVGCQWFEYIYTVRPGQPDVYETAGSCATGSTLTIGYDLDDAAGSGAPDGILNAADGDVVCGTTQTSAIPTPACGPGNAVEVVAGYTPADLGTLFSTSATCYTAIVPTLDASCPNLPSGVAGTNTAVADGCYDGVTPTTITGTNTGSTAPAGFITAYILTDAAGNVIGSPSTASTTFPVSAAGSYVFHTLVVEAALVPTCGGSADATALMACLAANNSCYDLSSSAAVTVIACGGGSPTIAITDPCTCAGGSAFDEQVTVTSAGPGEVWTVIFIQNIGGGAFTGTAAVGDVLTDNGDGTYSINFQHMDMQGYSMEVSNGTSIIGIQNLCAYPTLAATVGGPYDNCAGQADIPLTATITDASTPAAGTLTWGPASVVTTGPLGTFFNPSTLAAGSYSISAMYMGENTGNVYTPGGPPAYPGCMLTVDLPFDVTDCAVATCADWLPSLGIPASYNLCQTGTGANVSVDLFTLLTATSDLSGSWTYQLVPAGATETAGSTIAGGLVNNLSATGTYVVQYTLDAVACPPAGWTLNLQINVSDCSVCSPDNGNWD